MPLLLAIMFFASDVPWGMILSMADSGSLFVGHDAIDLGPVFHLVHMALLLIESIRLPLIQLPTGNPSIDPLFLVGLPMIDVRRLRLSVGHFHRKHDCVNNEHYLHHDLPIMSVNYEP
jgi:hypothetical protein